MNTTLFFRIRERWVADGGVTIRPAATEAELLALETKYQIELPTDMREYFKIVDGMEYGDMDSSLLSFRSVAEVARVDIILRDSDTIQSLMEPESYFVFCDYLVGSWDYAIQIARDRKCNPVIWICAGVGFGMVASSFTEFMDIYYLHPERIVRTVP